MMELIKLSSECKCVAVKLHPSFTSQYKNVEKLMSLPEYLQDALIDKKSMHTVHAQKKTFQEMA
jgi:hypothetical protein